MGAAVISKNRLEFQPELSAALNASARGTAVRMINGRQDYYPI
jgi:hypothetical protein